MENKQQRESQAPQWVRTWAEFILKQASNDIKQNEQSINLIEQILLATTQGDSCIEKPESALEQLHHLMVTDEQASHQQVAPFVSDEQYLYLYRYWSLEQRLALQVKRLKQQNIDPVDVQAFEHLLQDVHQKSALSMVAKNALNIITGGPGTGKTYTLARIIAVLSQAMPDIRIAMAAPTGKAAQRMKEAMQSSFADEKLNALGLVSARLKQQDTFTLHRLLGLGTQFKARFNLKQPLPYDVIVIDEASMLDLNLATLLFEAVPDHCRLILLGDANQLASVDVGSVLADLQNVDALAENCVNLITTRRFKAGARIGETAQFIQSAKYQTDSAQMLHAFEKQIVTAGELQPIPLKQGMNDVVQLEYITDQSTDQISAVALTQYYEKLSSGYQDYFHALDAYMQNGYTEENVPKVIDAFDRYRILTAIRYGELGLDRLNGEMQKALLKALPRIVKQGDWYIGRPVMMSYNDYQLGVSNGDIGLCFKHRTQADLFEVYFPSLDKWLPATRLPKSIQTAFALTIHKSQGSEFMHTTVVLDESATKLLSQELIYTAITRAKSVVSLLVSPNALRQALTIKTTRRSGLVNKMNKIVLSNI
ncbi:exodeoxyribonuclease V subunit alpha [Acinetobacter sp. TGL-Y2]|uniref:exodeoxyribonuclease V subunit alpha n=1 Tax=Acinetobacter sp. TGL-Y2 TaxID=1407071 RepID=UPI0007A65359|nr:exodeoxyribonuclease V subunit alpha [Acinetobacter sp. TGL-Y2]AMW79990.1 exodeoxyribonuclease V subunit alpha [Acinetobacter sp. TGL-Y2]